MLHVVALNFLNILQINLPFDEICNRFLRAQLVETTPYTCK